MPSVSAGTIVLCISVAMRAARLSAAGLARVTKAHYG